MESAFTNGMASNGVFGVICLIGYVIYKKCNSKCHYDKDGWTIDINEEEKDEEDENLDKIFALLTKQKSLKKIKKKDSSENLNRDSPRIVSEIININ